MRDIKNTADLRRMLLETIDGVRKGTVDAKQAQAIASLSSKIIQSAKLDLDALRFNASTEDTNLRAGTTVLQLVSA